MIGRLMRWEWRHWSTRRDIRVALISIPVLTFLWAWIGSLAMRSDAVPAFLSGSDATGFALAYRNTRSLHVLLDLLLLLWSSAAVSAELEAGLLRQVLLRASRRQLLWAKALHLFAVAAALSFGILLLSWMTGSATFGLEGVALGPITLVGRGELFATGLLAYLLDLLPIAALICFGLCIGTLVGGARAATTASLFGVVALWAIGQFAALAPLAFVSFANRPFAVALSRAEGYRNQSHADGLSTLIFSCLAWCLICLAIATWRFTRRDLK